MRNHSISSKIIKVIVLIFLSSMLFACASTPKDDAMDDLADISPVKKKSTPAVTEDTIIEEEPLPEISEEPIETANKESEAPEISEPAPEQEEVIQDIYFDYNKYSLTGISKEIIENNARYLLDNPDISIQIEGHCDERGSEEYNLALGEKRALTTKSYLETLGVQSNRLSWISYGEERPVDPGHTEDAWAKNRRVHFKIINRL